MYMYTLQQWLLFFFFYCFCGWVWESVYVSLRSKSWVNRGFMHGPMLPIYGSGAIVVLFLALPVRNNLALVFVFGMIGATILEYVTGIVMERLFHVRYWDYTGKPFNVNGYICLFCSIGWGLFSVALVGFVHRPVESFMLKIPDYIADPVVLIITVIAVVDFTQSFNAAMDLREMLEKAAENNERLRILEKRADVVAAVVDDEIRQLKEKSSKRLREIEEYVRNPKHPDKAVDRRRLRRLVKIIRRNPQAQSREFSYVLSPIKNVVLRKKKTKK